MHLRMAFSNPAGMSGFNWRGVWKSMRSVWLRAKFLSKLSPGKGFLIGQQFVRGDAKGEHIHALIDRLPGELFRRHVGGVPGFFVILRGLSLISWARSKSTNRTAALRETMTFSGLKSRWM
jgi:hypothetical protein